MTLRGVVEYMGTLRCIECEAASERFERGWRALLAAGTERNCGIEVVIRCPACSERELTGTEGGESS